MRLILINPNTNAASTRSMLDIACAAAGTRAGVEGRTAGFGAPLITEPAALALAAEAVTALAPGLGQPDGVIVAGFGDPGLAALRRLLACPVTGIAEAGMAEAAAGGRRFAVVTTTPALAESIAEAAARYGHAARFAGTWVTEGDPAAVMADPDRLTAALQTACRRAVEGGAEALVIGGGPLALAARRLAGTLPVPLIEPVPAAVHLAMSRAEGRAEGADPT